MTDLVIRAQNNDNEAFTELIREYTPDMYRVAISYLRSDEDAADAISETVLASFEHLPELREPRYFKTWLIRILINNCRAIKSQRSRTVAAEAVPETGASEMGYQNVEFMMLLDSLEPQYSMVLVLYYAEGFSIKEISSVTGLTRDAIKSRLKRGREKVKSIYATEKEALI